MTFLKFEATLLQKLLLLTNKTEDFSDITDKQIVEAAMLDHPLVDDCVVMVREAEMFRRELVAYVVLTGPFSLSQLQSHLQAVLPAAMLPSAYVPVSTLPLTDLGQVDEQALADLEVLDSNLVQRWQKRLWSVPEVEQVAVVVQEYSDIPPLHLSDLLPDWQTVTLDRLEPVAAAVHSVTVPQDESKPKTLAISHGELLASEHGLPTTLSAVLLRTALGEPKKGIVYFQSDGSEIVRSYAVLLEEAEQILAGLRKLGLKPQERVIFQFDLNQDFIPAFWGCILGGFVPVPISFQSLIGFYPEQLPSTYTTLRLRPEDVSHSNENRHNKLYNAWLMLDRPLILTSSQQATAIRSVANLLGLENLLVETIDDLRSCKPDQNWHESQPDDLAALFLTSGSTGMPKGVMLSHRNIISSVANVAQMNGFSSQDISFNWMPLEHVGSLVRCVIRDVYLGCVSIHAPTETVLQNPLLWLDWIEHYRATVTWAPNFAFGLINDQAEVIEQRRWDLSSMRFLLNTGEAIVAKTARRFLELLAPHGLATTTMYSAWGMSETSSGVTFSNRFLLDSLPKGASFVELGTPIAGIFLRIVDRQNQVLEEDTIGHLQVKGATVTAGYYQNPELNREVFTDDGWFRTGDLGFLHQGRLLITGREKEVIIINGINYYSHEIEAVVEEISGVEVSYTAACAIRTSNSNTDTLAIFFNSPLTEGNGLLELLKEVRGKVVRNVGTPVTYLIPVEKAAIPKTAIGKIQREQLKRRFEAGDFSAILKQIDIKSGNGNTLPDWFYRKVWRRKEGRTLLPQPRTGRYLVFLDQSGLGTLLCTKLGQRNLPYVGVEAGTDFALLGANRYRIDPKNPDHYCRLLESLSAEKLQIAQILHLWTYDLPNGESSLEALDLAQDQGIYSLLFLVQALAKVQSEHPVWLYVISSQTQPTSPADEIAYEKAPILGLIKTIPQEMPWVECCHIDLPVESVDANAEHVFQETQVVHKEQEVAYRYGQRLVPRLEKADLCQAQKQDLPFQTGGMYLISGGLGGIGAEIAKYLLQHYGVRLLLVGRTPLPEKKTWSAHLEQEDVVARRIQAYLALKQLGGEATYESVDICDLARLQEVVEQAKSRWQCQLDGVIHLAGIYQGRTLVEETRDSLAATLRPKMLGGWVLHQLLANQPNGGVFISFSSLSSFFGGAMIGGYAAANRFLDCFSHYQRHQLQQRSYCFAWSMWDGVGMSRDSQVRDILRAKGHLPMPVKQGLYSLLAGLHYDQAELLVGVEGSNRHIRQFLETKSYRLQKLSAYFTAKANPLSLTQLELTVRDRFQTRSTCNLLQLQEMPLTAMGGN